MGKKIIINGKFMSQTVTGVQRYAREILLALDDLVTAADCIEIAVSDDARNIPDYKNITVKKIGKLNGNLWEQISLPLYVRKERGLCVSMCNGMPIRTPDVVVVHDVNFKANPSFFSFIFRTWYKLSFNLCIPRTRKIITVSHFSKDELCKYYHVDQNKIAVIPSAWQHFERIGFDEDALVKYNLKRKDYYFAMGSMSPNKNFKWIAEVAKTHPENIFAVAGDINGIVFGRELNFEKPSNLRLIGYVNDNEAKTLMRDCKAFLFPTFYEGFGLPPLEAMSVGTKAVVSDTDCMREIYGNSVYYINPNNPNIYLDHLLKTSVSDPTIALKKYNWEKSARELLNILMHLK